MDAKMFKKIKKEFNRMLPKDETVAARFQEMHSEIQKLKLEIERRPSMDQLDTSNEQPEAETIDHQAARSTSEERITAMDSNKCDLANDLLSLLDKGYFADVAIHCDSEIFKAHKGVLCARSPIFEAMFTSPMQESEKDVVVIEDIEPVIFKTMLSFIYSGQVGDLCVRSACDLLYAAEKYQIKTLKNICVQYLQSNLNVDNCLSIFQCAELYDGQLKSDTLFYISTHFNELKTTEDWNQLQCDNPQMALQIYSFVVEMLQK